MSVETSSSGSSSSTLSPTDFSQRVTVPSVTDSPSAGRTTSVPSAEPPPVDCSALGAGAGAACSVEGAAAAGSGAGSAACSACGACSAAGAPLPSSISASSAPTSTVSSSATLMEDSTPEAGAGISVSTLSVETSSNGSSASTRSPSAFSQRVTVPSVTLSPSAGRVTETAMVSVAPYESAEVCVVAPEDRSGQSCMWSGLPASAR
ncbi:hypothetical protein RKD32_002065 [Streptomyces sp. SAI-195]